MVNVSKVVEDTVTRLLAEATQSIGQDRLDEADQLLDEILLHKPDEVKVPFMRGAILMKKGQTDKALEQYLQVDKVLPQFLGNISNIAISYFVLKRYEDAIVYFKKHLALDPKSVSSMESLAGCYYRLNELDEAIRCFREVLKLDPDREKVQANILLCMIYAESVSAQELTEEARRYGTRLATLYPERTGFTNEKNKDRKLRIGYISPDFRDHPVPYFVEPLLRHHDREKFETYAYSSTVTDNPVMERMKPCVDVWRDIRGLGVEETGDIIVKDKIDILIDLSGHTADNHLKVFARRAAPVQVTWLGYPATTGVRAMDYRITDIHAEPPGLTEHLNTEELWRLPHIFCAYAPHQNSPAVIDHPPCEGNGYITFGCFNNFIKVRDPVLAAWKQILEQVPGSRLLLEINGIEDAKSLSKVQERLRRQNIPLDRVTLEPRSKANQYVLYNKIDIALDPFPCVGGTTSMDTLWMGVPFVTIAGNDFVSRMGVTILSNAGLTELVAQNVQDYISTAVNLATDKERLKKIRHNLRDRFAKSPAMDQKAFARDMEEAYRGMWHKYCERPEASSQGGGDVESLFEAAKALMGKGRFDEALEQFRKILAIKQDVRAYGNMGLIYQNTGRLPQAIESFKQALALEPNSYKTLNNLGVISNILRRYDEAIDYYKKAIEADPNLWQTYNNLATSYRSVAKFDEAFANYKKAMALSPKEPVPYHNMLLDMVYCETVSPTEMFETALAFGKNVTDPLLRHRSFKNDKNPEKKLRIGYASPDFRDHAVNAFFEFIPGLHDRKNFEIFAYSKTIQEDKVTESIKRNVDQWRDIRFMDDDAAADLIEADGIDILVDLAGHTDRNCLMVFARKPAPVQVSWLGYPASTGMQAMDYRLTDNHTEPSGTTERWNTEKLCRLPDMFCCYKPFDGSPAAIGHPPFEDKGHITFGCAANFARVGDTALKSWAKIMAQVPDAKLLLEIAGIDSPQFRADTERRFEALGLPVERVIFEPRKPSNRHVLYNSIDIALDPFPAVGGTTSMDALWMGVPFVTLAGEVFAQRIGVSILENAGLPELVAANADEYVSKIVALAQDRARLKKLRHNLREKFANSPAMDQKAFVWNLEVAYRRMWRDSVASISG